MNIRKSLLTALLLAVLLLSMMGCSQVPAQTTTAATTAATTVPTVTTAPTVDASALYADAAAQLESMDDLVLEISDSREITVGGQSFVSESEQTLTYLDRSTQLLASLEETLTYNTYSIDIQEIFADGSRYIQMPEGNFRAAFAAEDYTAAFAPAVLLDAALYGSVTGEEKPGQTVLYFSEPTAPESWLVPEGASLIEAEGTVTLDENNAILQSTYTATYTYGAARYVRQLEVTPGVPEETSITAPEDGETYTELESAEALRLYEQAYGFLLQSKVATSTNTTRYASFAAGVISSRQTTMNMHNSVFKVQQSSSQQHSGQTTTYEQEELFRNGVYTVSADGGEPAANGAVDEATMYIYCMEMLLDNMLSTAYLSSAGCTDLGSTYLIEFIGTDAMGEDLCSTVCYKLFEDENLLNDLATDYATMGVECYLAIDKYTGLPTAVGINYTGSHTISGATYLLTMQSDQSFDLASQSAYKQINGELKEETPPEEYATPLLYRVSGENGQQMYLLGTIHVGDEKTGFLPQELYDAFSESDALAVECLNEEFEKALETDAELAQKAANAYYYTDGSLTSSHISDPELYEQALKVLKASGNYSYNSPLLKPVVWWQSIDNFYLAQGYALSGDKGVEERLLALAKEQSKQVREVESAIFQLQMLSGYSDALQEELLAGAVYGDSLEEQAATQELYEQWCRGDEGSLTQALTDDVSELTEEELALYNEYNSSMITDRNAGMAQVAKEYLESGETVFYAVGLAHVLGETGLVNALREAGYTVEIVTYA